MQPVLPMPRLTREANMGRHAKTETMLQVAVDVLQQTHPMTVRQVYYQLVSRQVIQNNRSQYQAVSNLLVEARGTARFRGTGSRTACAGPGPFLCGTT